MKKINLFSLVIIIAGLFILQTATAQSNTVRRADFDANWHFHLGDLPGANEINFVENSWRQLSVPHDWSIEGAFNKDNPAGVDGGALPGGIGWYRKTFLITEADKNKSVFIDFDGVYMNSDVWINGHFLGNRPYGYSSFQYELTQFLNYGNTPNIIAVRVDNSKQPNSRWYSGSGIYRNVWLVTTNKIHVDHWGTFVSTPLINDQEATVSAETIVRNENTSSSIISLTTILYNKNGKEVARSSVKKSIAGNFAETFSQQLKVMNPELWSTKNPSLYKSVSIVESSGKILDSYETPFGIRSFRFDSNAGFFLNGESLKIKGVCDHHDLGCLGAAINTRALERQLQMLKDMGCNAIRTSHNPPAPELLELADKMGILIMDEAFDCWKQGKNDFDYHLYWDQWHKKDLSDFIQRDRNHPSVIIWSIGNEIPDQDDSAGTAIALALAGIVHSLDTTRPITSAMNGPEAKDNSISRSGAMDLIGHNYDHAKYINFFKSFPGGKFIATETTSALETRGEYTMPSDSIFVWPNKGPMDANFFCSAYDNCRVPWGSTHEATLKTVMNNNFISGMFVWTGFDYLGEPTPYKWPARSSYFGIIDLAGFPKDAFYLYKSVWTNTPLLHILPDWNGWKIGDSVDVWAYYNNADKVQLFLNNQSLGIQSKQGDDMHVMWRVPYQPGTLKAVSYQNGTVVLSDEIHTSGPAAKMILEPDRNQIHADGKDLSFVTIKIVDANGNPVPHADNLINFKVSGAGFIAGVDNGNETDHDPFKADYHKAFNGLCLAVIQSKGEKGKITVTATSAGLPAATVIIQAEVE